MLMLKNKYQINTEQFRNDVSNYTDFQQLGLLEETLTVSQFPSI